MNTAFSIKHEGSYPTGYVTLVAHDMIFALIMIIIIIGTYYFYNYVINKAKPIIDKVTDALEVKPTEHMSNAPQTAGYLAMRGQVDDRPGHDSRSYMTTRPHAPRSNFLGGREAPVSIGTNSTLQTYYSQNDTTSPDTAERMTNNGSGKYFSDEALLVKAL